MSPPACRSSAVCRSLSFILGPELSILFRLAGAALEQPDETVRRAIYPVVGERTLRDLVREAMVHEAAMKRRIRPRALYGRLGTGPEVQTAQASAEQQRGWTGGARFVVWLLLHT